MKKNAFLFNTNKCVGCMACVAGCIIENGTNPGINWRVVNGTNKLRHPDLPVFYFSLACNHCEVASCMLNCPALAYSRDAITGAVIHHAELCIGCKYCTWACPYDAPKFNPDTQVVEKCNFCVDRISEGGKPACAVACPVGALDFGLIESGNEMVVPGFVDRGLKPAIHLVPLRTEHEKPLIWNDDEEPFPEDYYQHERPGHNSKISLVKEWTLVPFTLILAFLVAWLVSGITSGIPVLPQYFIGFGIISMLLSSLHLGKKSRAWRSILNLKNSWLSREIFSYSLFLGMGALYLFTKQPVSGYIALGAGIASLISVDMVYSLTERKERLSLHSSMVWISGLLIWSILTGSIFLIAFGTSLKAALYIFRKIRFFRMGLKTQLLLSFLRLSTLVIPVLLWFSGFRSDDWVLLFILLSGEIIDRLEFYNEIDVVTPARELQLMDERLF